MFIKEGLQFPINSVSLHFQQDFQSLEKEYRDFSFINNLKHIRICHYITIFFYIVLFWIDVTISPENSSIFFFIRFVIVCPLFCIGILVSYLPSYRLFYQYLLGFYVFLTAASFVAIGLYVPEIYHFVCFSSVIGSLIFGYIFLRLPFLPATAIGWLAGAGYSFVQLQYGIQDDKSLIIYSASLACFELLLMAICYSGELSSRKNFFLLHLLSVERDKTEAMNNKLTDIVEKRTLELEQLTDAMKKIKKLSGLLPICSSCKKIRDDKGYWNQIEAYITEHSEVGFSHGICPDCYKALYSDIVDGSK